MKLQSRFIFSDRGELSGELSYHKILRNHTHHGADGEDDDKSVAAKGALASGHQPHVPARSSQDHQRAKDDESQTTTGEEEEESFHAAREGAGRRSLRKGNGAGGRQRGHLGDL